MKLSNQFVLFALIALISNLCRATRAQECRATYVAHQIFADPANKKDLTVDGVREIQVSSIGVGGCQTSSTFPSGQALTLGTRLSLNATTRGVDNTCLLQNNSGTATLDSFSSILVRTPGWAFQPRNLRVSDIESQGNLPVSGGWQEAAVVFGMYGTDVVVPSVSVEATTVLSSGTFTIPSAQMSELGYPGITANVPGAFFNNPTEFDCGDPNADICQATFDFNSPIDTLIAIVVAVQKSTDLDSKALSVTIASIESECGCRCDQISLGSRLAIAPVPGVPGECQMFSTNSPVLRCAETGDTWCDKRNRMGYIKTGDALANGNVPCSSAERVFARYLQAFQP